MKKHFIISSMLALAMGLAQAQTPTQQQNLPSPMQGTSDPRTGSQRQTEVAPAAAQGMGPGGVAQGASQTFKGCLNGSAGSWTLTSDKGKAMTVSGTDNQLSPYKGQEVRINGVQASDGSITVASVDKVSDACENQSASNTGVQTSSTSQNDINNQSSTSTNQSATTTQPSDMSNQSSTAPSSTTDNSAAVNSQSSTSSTTTANSAINNQSAAGNTAPGATTPPVTNQTPANSVGSGQTAQSATQTPSTSTTDQNAASSTSSSDQNSTANQNQNTTGSDQNANQGVRQYSDMDQNAGNNNSGNKLPQTASPLPLLGLLGMGSLAAGLIGRRKK
jgi:hypothetical protein